MRPIEFFVPIILGWVVGSLVVIGATCGLAGQWDSAIIAGGVAVLGLSVAAALDEAARRAP